MESSLIFSYVLDGAGGGRKVDWEEIKSWEEKNGVLWMHLNYGAEQTQQWFSDESGLDPIVKEALLAEDTRPRCTSYSSGLLIILRGVNLNPGAEPDDMISVRLWIEKSRIISIRHPKVMAIDDIRKATESGNGPVDAGDFLVQLTKGLSYRIGDVLTQIDDSVDALEDEVIERGSYQHRSKLSALRRQIIRLRRHLAPQREVMTRLQTEMTPFLSDIDRVRLRETSEHVTRYVEDLDAAKDRAAVCQEELESRMGAQTNKTLYILAIITTIFLPLGLITGLLGINVGGIPGSDNPFAFVVVCVLLVAITLGQIVIFRKIRWV